MRQEQDEGAPGKMRGREAEGQATASRRSWPSEWAAARTPSGMAMRLMPRKSTWTGPRMSDAAAERADGVPAQRRARYRTSTVPAGRPGDCLRDEAGTQVDVLRHHARVRIGCGTIRDWRRPKTAATVADAPQTKVGQKTD